jgi:hypothetical protein
MYVVHIISKMGLKPLENPSLNIEFSVTQNIKRCDKGKGRSSERKEIGGIHGTLFSISHSRGC